jgi:uncharacterized protein YfaS (alpha-2-macroglobulin family)
MMRHWTTRGLAAAMACCTSVLNCTVVSSQDDNSGRKPDDASRKKATTQSLGGSARFQTFVSTDKPIYHSGEKVYVRGVVLNATNHRPWADVRMPIASVQIKGPKGDVVFTDNVSAEDSVWGLAWDVPDGQAGGEYSIHVTYPWDGESPADRKFDIRAYRAPRLKSQIAFLRDGYGPGEKVSATLDVKRAEGGVPEGAKVSVIANVDGIEIQGAPGKVDAKGLCSVSFDLPRKIPRGEGTLALVIEDGGVVETASKTIPILLQTVDLEMFPEGGDLVAGYANRVYVQAKQPNGKPADLAGRVMEKLADGKAETVTQFHTEHEGRGRFEFTPAVNRSYYLSIAQPAGIKTVYPLPQIKPQGAVLRSAKDVFGKGEPITVQVGCTSKVFDVTVQKREDELIWRKVDLSHAKDRVRGALHEVSLALPKDVDGVLTVTVWSRGVPLAERLIFREPANPLKISIKADRKNYIPGETAKLTIKTTDAQDKPVSAVVGLTVTDDSVLEMVEKRDQAPRLPVMVYLEPEVKDLADAHVYLDAKNPKAPQATDLLLGTQGWRRFAVMDAEKFVAAYGDDARRVLAMKTQAGTNFYYGPGAIQIVDERPFVRDFRSVAAGAPAVPQAAFAADFGGTVPAANNKKGALVPPPPAVLLATAANAPAPVDGARFDFAKKQWPAEMPAPAALPIPSSKAMARPAQAQFLEFGGVGGARGAFSRRPARQFGARSLIWAQAPIVAVRQFAHEVRKDRKPTDRIDFAETLFWNAGVKTDPKTGEARVGFGLNDSVSTFRVFADAFARDGAIGAANIGIESVQPFYAEAKMPLEVTAGDKVLLPINLINATASKLIGAAIDVELPGNFKLKTLLKGRVDITEGARVRWIQPIEVGAGNGTKDFTLSAKAGSYQDKITRKLSVKPKGFPVEVAFGGMIEPGKPVEQEITIPGGVVSESMVSNTAVYPTPLANMTEALERMIQDPNGCFEQTSSTSYPLTMAQQYFLSHANVDPKLVETSREKLDAGYKRLVGFWCPDRGYEWFGQNPGHEALTAFGLMHFTDMAQVREVDQNMIATTRGWLLNQKDGQGGFSRKRRSLHTWIEDKDDSNAYIEWALLESGSQPSELKPEINSLKTAAAKSQNSYVVALAANALFIAGEKADAKELMDRLAAKQKSDGSVDGVTSSIVGSGGESLEVEGTSLATLAWLRDPAYTGNVEKSIKFLADSCQSGRYGSTQATVLALRAIVTRDKQRAHPKAPGKVQVYVDGQAVGDWATFDASTQGAIKLPDLSELLTPGKHKLELRMEGGSQMPYSMAVKYNALTPVSDKNCKVDLTVKMAQNKVVEGSATEANVTMVNTDKEVIPNPVAIVGLPGGMEPRHDQLKELVKKGKIDAYEVRGREVVLYWRTLAGQAKVDVPISLIAAVPGSYTGPASRAYLYYTDEHKRWVDGLHVEIAPK